MDYAAENKNAFWKLFALFVLFTTLGTVLSAIYNLILPYITITELKVLVISLYIILLFSITKYLLKTLKIANGAGSVAAVCLALIVVNYLKWNFHFGLTIMNWEFEYIGESITLSERISSTAQLIFEFIIHPQWFIDALLYVQEYSGWTYGDTLEINGIVIWFIWTIELIMIVAAPIAAAISNHGLYIGDSKQPVYPTFMGYYFSPFDNYAISKILEKDISVIVNQEAVTMTTLKSFWRVAYFSIDGGTNEYIALYKNTKFGMRKKTALIHIGDDLFKKLQHELFEKHFPMVKENNENQNI